MEFLLLFEDMDLCCETISTYGLFFYIILPYMSMIWMLRVLNLFSSIINIRQPSESSSYTSVCTKRELQKKSKDVSGNFVVMTNQER
ncbi:unnamed protein product [Lactuca virosa]|uniref:Uncharacterized protein n=1 Tax=Lactuca virosa TaxID=75947 RepID=A0AAU9LLL0_9ASTR|nr:unnamed protein product [Lactuca virosa]